MDIPEGVILQESGTPDNHHLVHQDGRAVGSVRRVVDAANPSVERWLPSIPDGANERALASQTTIEAAVRALTVVPTVAGHDPARCGYCVHGPWCPVCPPPSLDAVETRGMCRACQEAVKSAEIAADPYYRGDYVAMFGDDA